MSDVTALLIEPPDPRSGLRKAVEAERRKVDLWEEKLIKAIRQEKTRLLREVTDAEASLAKSVSSATRRKSKRRGRSTTRGRKPTVVGQKQREGILGLLRSEKRDMAMGEIRKVLNIPESSAGNALRFLIESGMVRPVGSGSRTRYGAVSTNGESEHPYPDAGTLQGRLLEAITACGQASLDELTAIVGAPAEEVQRNCGALLRDDEIYMNRVDGHPVYVMAEATRG